jgi:hypothetical protein
MHSLISSAVSTLREAIPDVDSHIVKLDLSFMTIIIHPQEDKLICIANDGTNIDWFNVIVFFLELTECSGFANLFFAACFFDEENKLITEEMSFKNVPWSYYKVASH